MSTSSPTLSARGPLWLLAGPALVGACLGLPAGVESAAQRAAILPAVILGVALLMLPALYVSSALLGLAPAAQRFARASFAALVDLGLVLLGLAPALFFLVAATPQPIWIALLGLAALGAATSLALRGFYRDLFADPATGASPTATVWRALPLFGFWAVVSAGIGLRLVIGTVIV